MQLRSEIPGSASVSARPSLSPSAILTVGSLIGVAIVMLQLLLVIYGQFVPPYFVVALVSLIAAGIIATRWRWAPAVGAFVGLLQILMAGTGVVALPVSNPQAPSVYAVLLLGIVTLVSGVAATVQNYRKSEGAPASGRVPLVGALVGGAVLGLLTIGTLQQIF